jgi:predicted NBD/HSP70 family sugar kinase
MLIGIEIGGTKLQLVVGDKAGGVHHRQTPLRPSRQARLESDGNQADPAGANGKMEVTAIGVGFGGPVD